MATANLDRHLHDRLAQWRIGADFQYGLRPLAKRKTGPSQPWQIVAGRLGETET